MIYKFRHQHGVEAKKTEYCCNLSKIMKYRLEPSCLHHTLYVFMNNKT